MGGPPQKRRRKGVSAGQTLTLEFSAKEAILLEDLKRLVPAGILAIGDCSARCRSVALQSERKNAAQKEIERILRAEARSHPVLVGDTQEERRAAFRQIILLLHPDLGF